MRTTNLIGGLLAVGLILFGISCELDPASTADPELTLSTTSLDFGSQQTEKTFTIINTGDGTLEWTITKNQDWLTVSTYSGTTTSENDQITVTVNRSNLSTGDYSGTITVAPEDLNSKTISVQMTVASQLIWSFEITDNSDLDHKWECFDYNDDLISGEDYWGVVRSNPPGGEYAVWCAGRGQHTAGIYANNMVAWMRLREQEAINIRDYSDVTIKFWMAFDTETDTDFMRFLVQGNDNVWYYLEDTIWSGGDYTWRQY